MKREPEPIETTKDQYLYSVIDWYTHFRKMEGHRLSVKLAKEKAASMWSCDNSRLVDVVAEDLMKSIDELLRGVDND